MTPTRHKQHRAASESAHWSFGRPRWEPSRAEAPTIGEGIALQRLHSWQLCITNPISNGMPLPLFAFHRPQRLQVPDMAVMFFDQRCPPPIRPVVCLTELVCGVPGRSEQSLERKRATRSPGRSFQLTSFNLWCGEGDLNPHEIAPASTSSAF